MAKLTAKARKAIPTKNFAGPDRSYPIEDASHARNALARVSQHGSSEVKAKVRAKVKAKYPGIKQAAKQPHPETNPGSYDTEPHAPERTQKKKHSDGVTIHIITGFGKFPSSFGPKEPKSHGFGHSVANRSGSLRMSGHSGAHRIGKR